jgi:hypothetical protein
MTSRGVLAGFLTLGSILTLGCDRTYLTPSHGRAYRETFAVQTVNPRRHAEAKSVQGLDSQEASIIAHTYRKLLAPTTAGSGDQNQGQVLTVSRGAGAGAAPMPASAGPSGEY